MRLGECTLVARSCQMTSRYRTQSLDRRDRSLVERDFVNHFGSSTASDSEEFFRTASNGAIDVNDNDVTAVAWRQTATATGKGPGANFMNDNFQQGIT